MSRTDGWKRDLDRATPGSPFHAAVAEVVRLRRAFTEWADQLDTLMDEMDEKGHTLNADQISAVTAGIRLILEGNNE